ncbi:MAG TPA: peptide deformylase [Leptolyngbyaceae cyanobacterium M33_DOE_097]|uniref:Peptide deformylase n=1 Tax=Oscillatoriales cyanobacterium SpSt-418 TaxID=2282169 RepID=A0A7C3KH81_9CYAN|nr:peptide deformylase [Leptolyngbyaceae cyanobacterium M33_DOE_097]
MAEPRPIVELGNPVLRQTAAAIADPQDPALQALIDDLLHTVTLSNGVGIAAPQVAESLQLFIVASRPNPRYPNAPEMEPTAMLNPKILAHNDELEKGWEGCLSVPGLRGMVPRYTEIEVEYWGRDGKATRQILTDFIARIFQHELDHLNGLVFLDRVESTHDLISEKEFQARMVTPSAN